MIEMIPFQTGDGDKSDKDLSKAKNVQKRISLINHAMKCRSKDGKCDVSRHCTTMKRVLQHCIMCKNSNCAVSHCLSTRQLIESFKDYILPLQCYSSDDGDPMQKIEAINEEYPYKSICLVNQSQAPHR